MVSYPVFASSNVLVLDGATFQKEREGGGGVRGVFARAPARARFVLSLIEPIFIDDFQSQTSKMIGLYRAFSG